MSFVNPILRHLSNSYLSPAIFDIIRKDGFRFSQLSEIFSNLSLWSTNGLRLHATVAINIKSQIMDRFIFKFSFYCRSFRWRFFHFLHIGSQILITSPTQTNDHNICLLKITITECGEGMRTFQRRDNPLKFC